MMLDKTDIRRALEVICEYCNEGSCDGCAFESLCWYHEGGERTPNTFAPDLNKFTNSMYLSLVRNGYFK